MALKIFTTAVLFLMAEGAFACATCSGTADAPQTHGMNAGILTLFGVLCLVGLVFATFVGSIAWRIARYSNATQQHDDTPVVPVMTTLEF